MLRVYCGEGCPSHRFVSINGQLIFRRTFTTYIMIKTSQKLLRFTVALLLIGTLTIGVVYLLASTVPLVRTALTGTVFERFLPHGTGKDDHDHTESAFQGELIEITLSPTAARNFGLDDSAIMTVEVVDY